MVPCANCQGYLPERLTCATCDFRGVVFTCELCLGDDAVSHLPVPGLRDHAACSRCIAAFRLPAPPRLPRDETATIRPGRVA
jgi:hypothetical protein